MSKNQTISIIIPTHNEEENVPLVYKAVQDVFAKELSEYALELIFVDDGSTDATVSIITSLTKSDDSVRLVEFSRNFGKEAATTAGLHASTGDAVMMIDADMQHPPVLIPTFVHKWKETRADVVIGIRTKNTNEGIIKKFGSKLFYKIMATISDEEMKVGETDFRLVTRCVINEFNKLTEHNRMTRSLLNWLGFHREYIEFEAPERAHGEARYTVLHLVHLALNSFVSNSTKPLEIIGYFGGIIAAISFVGGSIIFVEHYLLNDILGLNVSNVIQLAILLVFLVGLLLLAIGIIGVYIGSIAKNSSARPLYIVKNKK